MTAGQGEKRSRKQQQDIAALLTAPTMAEAAARCGISEKTLWRWSQNPEFAVRFREARSRALEAAINKLCHSTYQAAVVLLEISTNKRASSSSRVSAARAIFEIAIKVREFHELENRVAELENYKAAPTHEQLESRSAFRREPPRDIIITFVG